MRTANKKRGPRCAAGPSPETTCPRAASAWPTRSSATSISSRPRSVLLASPARWSGSTPGRRSRSTRSSPAPAYRSSASRRCRTTSRWLWRRRLCASKRRFPASRRWGSRFRTSPRASSRSARCWRPRLAGGRGGGTGVRKSSGSLVTIREVLETAAFREGTNKLALGLGNDVSGQSIIADLTRMPHLLIAGATGQGKSVCINALITSLLFQATPEHMRLLLIDPKRVELNGYHGLPHLALPVLVESHQAAAALRWAVAEMDRRYKMFSAEGVRNIAAYNEKATQRLARRLPYIVIVIDELADLMMVAAGEIEELICRIRPLARAVGIHLIIATQRPSTDIITGLIKANIPSRIAFAVSSQVDSRVILDTGGAEKLLGRGDMLYQPVDSGKPTRIQGAFVSDPEVEGVVNFWKSQGGPRFMEEILEEGAGTEWERGETTERKLDPLFARSARAVAAEGSASVSLVQRKFNVGYSRAGRIVDQLAEHHVVGAYQGSKSRDVLMTLPDVDELLDKLGIE